MKSFRQKHPNWYFLIFFLSLLIMSVFVAVFPDYCILIGLITLIVITELDDAVFSRIFLWMFKRRNN